MLGARWTTRTRAIVVWAMLLVTVAVPLIAAAGSPQLAWRSPIYIMAGFAGVIAFCLMLAQPLLAGGYLPGFSGYRGRRMHRWVGCALVSSFVVHIVGLWITSPPDVIDALLFASPTPFSVWGVIAMWAIFVVAILAVLRQRLHVRPRTWRIAHLCLAGVIVIGTIVHALLIEGTMETVSKVALCALVLVATAKMIADLRLWRGRARSKRHAG